MGGHPARPVALFTSFLNDPEASDPELSYVRERGQRRPAGPVLVAGATLPTTRS